MNFHEAEHKYNLLLEKRSSGKISSTQFAADVSKLRFVDPENRWWQINPEDGSWFFWDGKAWVRSPKKDHEINPHIMTLGSATTDNNTGPQSLLDLVPLIFKSLLRGIVKKAIISLLIMISVWVIHTYLMAYVNDGFYKVKSPILAMVLALQGGKAGGAFFWTLSFGIMVSIYMRLRTKGFRQLFSDFKNTPSVIKSSLNVAGQFAPILFFAGSIVALILSFYFAHKGEFIANRLVSILSAFALILCISNINNGFLFLITRLAWQDTSKLLPALKTQAYKPHYIVTLLFGMASGFILATLLPFMPWTGYLSIALLFVATILALSKRLTAPSIFLCLFFTATVYLFFMKQDALACYGGFHEYGGSWDAWLNREGGRAFYVMRLGIPPAVGAGLLGYLTVTTFSDLNNLCGADSKRSTDTEPDDSSSIHTGGGLFRSLIDRGIMSNSTSSGLPKFISSNLEHSSDAPFEDNVSSNYNITHYPDEPHPKNLEIYTDYNKDKEPYPKNLEVYTDYSPDEPSLENLEIYTDSYSESSIPDPEKLSEYQNEPVPKDLKPEPEKDAIKFDDKNTAFILPDEPSPEYLEKYTGDKTAEIFKPEREKQTTGEDETAAEDETTGDEDTVEDEENTATDKNIDSQLEKDLDNLEDVLQNILDQPDDTPTDKTPDSQLEQDLDNLEDVLQNILDQKDDTPIENTPDSQLEQDLDNLEDVLQNILDQQDDTPTENTPDSQLEQDLDKLEDELQKILDQQDDTPTENTPDSQLDHEKELDTTEGGALEREEINGELSDTETTEGDSPEDNTESPGEEDKTPGGEDEEIKTPDDETAKEESTEADTTSEDDIEATEDRPFEDQEDANQDDETLEQDETLTDEEASAEDVTETDDGEAESTEDEGEKVDTTEEETETLEDEITETQDESPAEDESTLDEDTSVEDDTDSEEQNPGEDDSLEGEDEEIETPDDETAADETSEDGGTPEDDSETPEDEIQEDKEDTMQDDETPEQDETLTDEEASAEDATETDDGEAKSTEDEGEKIGTTEEETETPEDEITETNEDTPAEDESELDEDTVTEDDTNNEEQTPGEDKIPESNDDTPTADSQTVVDDPGAEGNTGSEEPTPAGNGESEPSGSEGGNLETADDESLAPQDKIPESNDDTPTADSQTVVDDPGAEGNTGTEEPTPAGDKTEGGEPPEDKNETKNIDISVEEKSWNEYLDIYKGEIEKQKTDIEIATKEIERLEAFDNPDLMGDTIDIYKNNIEIAKIIIEDKVKEIQSLETVDEKLRDIFYTELPPVDVETPLISMDANLLEKTYQSFSENNWSTLNDEQRIEVIKETANALKKGLGCNNDIVIDIEINPNIGDADGQFIEGANPRIEISPRAMNDPEKIMEIIGHETRHYQQINRNESTSLGDPKFDELALKNHSNQFDAKKDIILYRESFIERDARNFAEHFVKEFKKRIPK